ncbi:MAG: response regulator transcription factor [Rubrobacteraceae bacterium]
MKPVTNVIVVASSPVVRAGLRSVLTSLEDPGLKVVGEAESLIRFGPEALGTDVYLVADEELLQDAASSLTEDDAPSIVLLSEEARAVSTLRTLLLRGWGIVPPDAPPEEIAAALIAAAQGLVLLSGELAERLLGEAVEVEDLSEPLTAREGEMLELLSRGLSNKMIARELHISEHTVKFHISSLYAKLEVNNRAEAVSSGARHGLLSL